MGCVYSTLGSLFPSIRRLQLQTALERLRQFEAQAAVASTEHIAAVNAGHRQAKAFAMRHKDDLKDPHGITRMQLQRMLTDLASRKALMTRANDTLGHLRTAMATLSSQLATEHAGTAAREVAGVLQTLGINAESIEAQAAALEDGVVRLHEINELSSTAVPPSPEHDHVTQFLESLAIEKVGNVAMNSHDDTQTELFDASHPVRVVTDATLPSFDGIPGDGLVRHAISPVSQEIILAGQ